MKISNLNSRTLENIAKNELNEAGKTSTGTIFKSQLASESKSAYFGHIKSLIADIEKQGKKLTEKADMTEMQKYREMITALINETVSNGFAFEKEGKMGFNGRSKVFAIIRKVNDKLDTMTQKVLEDEKDNLSLLDDIDDIRGLLIDMYY